MIKLVLLLLWALWLLPLAASAETLQKVQFGASCVFGAQTVSPNQLFNYTEPDATQCQYTVEYVVKLDPSATNVAVSFADLFPVGSVPVVVGAADISGQNFDLGLETSGARIHINANGYFVSRVSETSPIFFLDNPSGSQAAYVKLFGLSAPP